MIKRSIPYTDLDGATQSDEYYFNLNKMDLAKLSVSEGQDTIGYFQSIVKDMNGAALIQTFEKILMAAVGKRSDDGKRFIKTTEISDYFVQSGARDELMIELVSNAEDALAFVRGIVPSDMAKEIETAKWRGEASYSELELLEMDDAEFQRVVGSDPREMSPRGLMVAYKRRANVA